MIHAVISEVLIELCSRGHRVIILGSGMFDWGHNALFSLEIREHPYILFDETESGQYDICTAPYKLTGDEFTDYYIYNKEETSRLIHYSDHHLDGFARNNFGGYIQMAEHYRGHSVALEYTINKNEISFFIADKTNNSRLFYESCEYDPHSIKFISPDTDIHSVLESVNRCFAAIYGSTNNRINVSAYMRTLFPEKYS